MANDNLKFPPGIHRIVAPAEIKQHNKKAKHPLATRTCLDELAELYASDDEVEETPPETEGCREAVKMKTLDRIIKYVLDNELGIPIFMHQQQ